MGLKGISPIISPDLLHALYSMGHGDEIVLADIHFPTSGMCKKGHAIEIRADGLSIPDLLEAILALLPLDPYSFSPVKVMEVAQRDKDTMHGDPAVWEIYKKIINKAENKSITFVEVERFEFYEQASNSYAIVHTGERSKYGNIILKKGLVEYNH